MLRFESAGVSVTDTWHTNTAESSIKDLREACYQIEADTLKPIQPSTVLAQIVDWLPMKLKDGTWMHWCPLSPDLVALSRHAYNECLKLPEGIDWYYALK